MVPVFNPSQNKFRLVLDILLSVIIIYRLFIITIKIGFFITDLSQALDLIPNSILFVVIGCFFLENAINMNSGFYEKGNLILNRKKIF
jgi:hypothetical protein